jgi:hypothetical protein
MIEDPISPSSRLCTCRDHVPGRLTHRENIRAAHSVSASIYVLKEEMSIPSLHNYDMDDAYVDKNLI